MDDTQAPALAEQLRVVMLEHHADLAELRATLAELRAALLEERVRTAERHATLLRKVDDVIGLLQPAGSGA